MRLTRTNSSWNLPAYARRGVPAFVVAVGATFITLPAAQAAPDVTVKDVEAAFHQAEAMNEQVNQLGEDISKTSKQIADLSAEISEQTVVFDQQREALSATIVQQQMDSPLGNTAGLLGSGDSQAFIDGLGAVQTLNASRTDALGAFAQVSAQLENRKTQLDDRRSSLEADKKDAAAKKQKVKATYDEAKADLARLTAAEQTTFNSSDVKVDSSDIKVDLDVSASGHAKTAVDFAMAQLGEPYVYGGNGPNQWDCSGLVQKAWAAAGVSLPRVVGPQMSAARSIPMSQLQPGDLVAYSSMAHIGIYVGNGRVVHAPRPGKSVEITGLGGFSVAGRVG